MRLHQSAALASVTPNPRLKMALLKAFLLGCEARGWVSRSGRLKWHRVAAAKAYWMGVRMALGHVVTPLSGDVDLAELTTAADPFVSASALHKELCARAHEGVAA
jgi:hypothetical protein